MTTDFGDRRIILSWTAVQGYLHRADHPSIVCLSPLVFALLSMKNLYIPVLQK